MAAALEPINTNPTYADVDRGVHRIMETPGLLFWAWIAFCATLVAIAGALWTRQIYEGPRRHRPEAAHDVGGLHHELRVLGRNRALGHADLRDSLPLPHSMADRGLSPRRDDDLVCGAHRRTVSAHSSWPCMECLLAVALPQRALSAAELPLAAGMGRLRGVDLPHHQRDLPADGTDSRRRQRARRGQGSAPNVLLDPVLRMARHRRAMAALPDDVPAAGRPRDAAGHLGPQRSVVGLRDGAACPDGTARFSRRTSSRARFSPASRWY